MPIYTERFNAWMNSNVVSQEDKKELADIAQNEDEIKSRFGEYMEFGTGGLRSTMGPGTARMNKYTVAHITQAISNLIIEERGQNSGVAIAYDSRNNSKLFAETTASVFAANGIKVYIFESVAPTPELSFSLLYHKCIAGVNVTASHNPKEYNGYKVYWKDGAQLPVAHAQTVTDKAATIDIFNDVKIIDFNKGVQSGIINIVGKEVDEAYLKAVQSQIIDPCAIKNASDKLKVVYTPLHGAGYRLVPEILSRVGLKHLYTVDEQMILDGNFPTVKKPNPEYPETLELAKKLAEKKGSDLIIATDPDSDRLACMVRKSDGEYEVLSGNQTGLLLLDYIITAYKNNNTMPENPFAVKTIVSSKLAEKICSENGVTIYNVLTGFKYIGEMIKLHDCKDGHYIFGFEESCGYLKGTYTRDKDGVVAAMLVCEMAAHYMLEGKTLYDALTELYKKYGYSFEKTEEIITEGLNAKEKQENIMASLRSNPPKNFKCTTTKKIADLNLRKIVDIENGDLELSKLPKSNVICYELANSDTIVIRPSGTEPKVKLYFLISGKDKKETFEKYKLYKSTFLDFISNI